tara:strand:+ start:523 stop:1602 length:1080 start_codon:yes stop_codon:yes gene_type:complete
MRNIVVVPAHYKGTSFEEISRAFKIAAERQNLDVSFVGGKVFPNNLPHGQLDDLDYTREQLKILQQLIEIEPKQKGEPLRILFLDAFNPGLDILRYAHTQRGVNATYSALVHGGSYLENDLYSETWVSPYEAAWLQSYNRLYVSSPYSKSKLSEDFQGKTVISPWGMDAFQPADPTDKDIDVIFPHRLDSDKGVKFFIDVAESMPHVRFLVTQATTDPIKMEESPYYKIIQDLLNVSFAVGENDEDHHKTLRRSKIVFSHARQELFGYSVMKAVLSDCIPVVPNDQCYPNFFPQPFRYATKHEACTLIDSVLTQHKQMISSPDFEQLKKQISSFSFGNILSDFIRTAPSPELVKWQMQR